MKHTESRITKHKRFLVRHVGNMGDHVFFIPPVLESLKKHHPNCHITLVAAWGFKINIRRFGIGPKTERWGQRNQGGFCLNIILHNPHVDQLIHWHDTKTSLAGNICMEEGRHIPTWSANYYEQQKKTGGYDGVFELDFGITPTDNPIERMYQAVGLPTETFSNYKLYLTEDDRAVATAVMTNLPSPRIILLEGLSGTTTRGWDPDKIAGLQKSIEQTYGVTPWWFGGAHVPEYEGRPLTLRENIATLELCDVGIGVLSGPLHFAAAVGLPTITLYADQSLHRAAPAYFLNEYITDPKRYHRTILGPGPQPPTMLKSPTEPTVLTSGESARQHYRHWTQPGNQATKAALGPITVTEIMKVLADILPPT